MLSEMIAGIRARWHGLREALNEARPYLVNVVLAAALISTWLAPVGELATRVKATGFLFQLLGLVIVVLGLSEARKLFGRPSISRGFLSWLRALAMRIMRGPPSASGQSARVGTAREFDQALPLCDKEGSPPTLEARLKRIETRLDAVQGSTAALTRRMSDAERDMAERIEAEASTRENADAELWHQLEEAVIGGIHLEFIGVCYLSVGMVLTTFPADIAEIMTG